MTETGSLSKDDISPVLAIFLFLMLFSNAIISIKHVKKWCRPSEEEDPELTNRNEEALIAFSKFSLFMAGVLFIAWMGNMATSFTDSNSGKYLIVQLFVAIVLFVQTVFLGAVTHRCEKDVTEEEYQGRGAAIGFGVIISLGIVAWTIYEMDPTFIPRMIKKIRKAIEENRRRRQTSSTLYGRRKLTR